MKTLFTSKKIIFGLAFTIVSQLIQAQAPFCFKTQQLSMPGLFGVTGMVATDLNNDGKVDLATSNYTGFMANLSTSLGFGNGTFSAVVNSTLTVDGSHGITAGVFGGPGAPRQLAVTNKYSNNISILLGNGVGPFITGTSIAVGSQPTAIITNDYNNDGNFDLAVVNSGGSSISILKGVTGGNFLAAVNYPVGAYPMGIASGDFNTDGNLDLVVANYSSNNISILSGSATGTFATAVNYAVGTNPHAVATGDYNGDGNLDLAVANYSSNNLSVLMGSITGTFSPAVNYVAGTQPQSIVSSDFNSDGFLDLACANYGSNNVSIFAGLGTGAFAAAVNFSTDNLPKKIVVADFNGDGKSDIATANDNQTTTVLINGEPTLSVNSGTICAGNSFTISPTGGNQYTYSSGSAIVSPTVTTTYTITGCANTNTIECTVNVSSTSTISVNSGSICLGQTFTVMPNGADTYTYALQVGPNTYTYTGNTQSFGPPIAGTYIFYINGTNSNGCIATSPVTSTIVVSACATGLVDAMKDDSGVSIYPNPNNGEFTIQSKKSDIVVIANELGQIIQTIKLNQENNFTYKVNSLQNGIYFLVGEAIKQKVVVTK